jgi:hypothetical protein
MVQDIGIELDILFSEVLMNTGVSDKDFE